MEFFTWSQVLTGGVAALVVTFIVQFVKGFTVPLDPNVLRFGVYLISVALLNAAALFTGGWDTSFLGLSLINGILVALAALGEYEILKTAGMFKSSAEIRTMRASR